MMMIKRGIIFLIIGVSSVVSQIQGIVQNSIGQPLEGCTVDYLTLPTAVSDNQGRFTIGSVSINSKGYNNLLPSLSWGDKGVILFNPKDQLVMVEIRGLNGQLVAKPFEEFKKAGPVFIRYPSARDKSRLFIRLSLSEKSYLLRWNDQLNHTGISNPRYKGASAADSLTVSCTHMAPEYLEITSNPQDLGTISVRSPNVIIVFVDDSGFGDYGFNGQTLYTTPELDKLAAAGSVFKNFYVPHSACSSSRSALLSGSYATRIGVPWVCGSPCNGKLTTEKTIGDMVLEKGYSTAMFGKWHLGENPLDHGFQEFFGISRSHDYASFDVLEGKSVISGGTYQHAAHPYLTSPHPLQGGNNKTDTATQEMLTKWFTERSVEFINRKKDEPFFLYLAFNQPHVEVHSSAAFQGKSGLPTNSSANNNDQAPPTGAYAEAIMELDWGVGQVIDALKTNNIDKKTIVFFTSDNGPWGTKRDRGSPLPFRGWKRQSLEGGSHMPGIVWWPGRIKAGSQIDPAVMTIDIVPTLASIMGGDLPNHKIDGIDVSSLIFDENGTIPDRFLYYWNYNMTNVESVRYKNWKYHTADRNNPMDLTGSLWDLSNDIREMTDVKGQNGTIVQMLVDSANAANTDIMTGPNSRRN